MSEYTLGIDIGGTSVKLGVVKADEGIVWRRQVPFVKGDPMQMLGSIAEAAKAALSQFEIDVVGVSVAGKVDPRRGTTQADNLGWMNVPVRDSLKKLLGRPVWIDNDGECAMLAEWKDGACAGVRNVAYFTYGTGVGGGLIIDGRPYRGRLHSGAELGHVIVHGGADALPCNCGHSGCYEVYASTTALKRLLDNQFTVKEIVDNARAGEDRFVQAFDNYIEEIALGLISVMAVLSPDCVVLGGGLSNAGEFFLSAVQRRMDRCEPWLTAPTKIVLAKYGNDAGMLGAAALAERHLKRRR